MRITIPIYKKDVIAALIENGIPVKTKSINAVERQIESIAIAWASAWLQDADKRRFA